MRATFAEKEQVHHPLCPATRGGPWNCVFGHAASPKESVVATKRKSPDVTMPSRGWDHLPAKKYGRNAMSQGLSTTTDTLLTAFLQVRGHELLDLRPNGDGRAIFVFRDSEQLKRDAKDFLEDGFVRVRTFSKRMAKLRDACRELRRPPTNPQQGQTSEDKFPKT